MDAGAQDSDLDPILEVDDLRVITAWSKRAERLLGWTAADVCGQGLCERLLASVQRPAYLGCVGALADVVTGAMHELMVRHKDGREFPALFKVLSVTRQGERTRYRLSVRALCALPPAADAATRLAAEDELRHQQFLLQYILNFVPHAIFWKDRQARFLGGNQPFLTHGLGVQTAAEVIGKTDYDFFPAEQAEYFRRCDFAVMDSGQPMLDIEEPASRSGLGARVLLTSKVPLRDESGEIIGLLGIYADITQRKAMEEELKQAKKAAEAAAEAKSRFLTTVSHELRTPLALILGPLATLLASPDEQLTSRARAYLGRIQRNSRRLHHLVDDILDHQKIEAGKMTVEWEPVEVSELCVDLVEDARLAVERSGLTIELCSEPTLGTVPLDRHKFEKILLNLLGNAIKFTPASGQIWVRLQADAEHFELHVEDTGPGIAADKMHLLFQRFQQLDNSPTRAHEGTGIGLSLIKELAELMGGSVRVRSEVGRGSCFIVRLPRTAPLGALARPGLPPSGVRVSVEGSLVERQTAEPRPARRVERNADRAARLLIAEDNADMRAYLAEILADEYEVELQPNGRAALAAAQARPPMVIISDVMMPELDGFGLVAQLKQDPALRDVPVLLLTARASRRELVSGLDLGADDYLAKPFDPEELKARVRAAERLHRLYLDLAAKNNELTTTLRQLADSQAELLQAGKMAAVGTLLAGLSHELNNPLGVILMNAQLILRKQRSSPGGLDAATLQKPLHLIETQAMRCADLVRTLLEYVRRKPVTREPCEVRVALERVLTIAGLQASKRKVRLEVQYDLGVLPVVLVSPTQLDSALLNIINNALDAVAEGGSVVIAARPRAHNGTPGLELQVRDTGCGISAEIYGRIGEAFFTTKPPGQGTGLGLSMTKRFFEDHSGDLRIESQAGVGTTVYMWLPAMSAVTPTQGPAAS